MDDVKLGPKLEDVKAASKLIMATVAARRSVVIDDPAHPRGRTCAPGTMVRLPAAEVKRLRALGYLVDPQALEVEVSDGSSVFNEPR